jgi:hypothetical protein
MHNKTILTWHFHWLITIDELIMFQCVAWLEWITENSCHSLTTIILCIYSSSQSVFRSWYLWSGYKLGQGIDVPCCETSSQWADGCNLIANFWTPLMTTKHRSRCTFMVSLLIYWLSLVWSVKQSVKWDFVLITYNPFPRFRMRLLREFPEYVASFQSSELRPLVS